MSARDQYIFSSSPPFFFSSEILFSPSSVAFSWCCPARAVNLLFFLLFYRVNCLFFPCAEMIFSPSLLTSPPSFFFFFFPPEIPEPLPLPPPPWPIEGSFPHPPLSCPEVFFVKIFPLFDGKAPFTFSFSFRRRAPPLQKKDYSVDFPPPCSPRPSPHLVIPICKTSSPPFQEHATLGEQASFLFPCCIFFDGRTSPRQRFPPAVLQGVAPPIVFPRIFL